MCPSSPTQRSAGGYEHTRSDCEEEGMHDCKTSPFIFPEFPLNPIYCACRNSSTVRSISLAIRCSKIGEMSRPW